MRHFDLTALVGGSFCVYLLVASIHGCSAIIAPMAPCPEGDGSVLDPVACAAAHTKSGSRLKVRFLRAEDGAEAFLGWRDTKLDVDCYWAPAGDGKMRCLPIVAGSGPAGTYFADGECRELLVTAPSCSTSTLRYGVTSASMPCGIARRVYEADKEPVEPSEVFVMQAGDCVPGAMPSGYVAYRLWREMSPDEFVEGTEASE